MPLLLLLVYPLFSWHFSFQWRIAPGSGSWKLHLCFFFPSHLPASSSGTAGICIALVPLPTSYKVHPHCSCCTHITGEAAVAWMHLKVALTSCISSLLQCKHGNRHRQSPPFLHGLYVNNPYFKVFPSNPDLVNKVFLHVDLIAANLNFAGLYEVCGLIILVCIL